MAGCMSRSLRSSGGRRGAVLCLASSYPVNGRRRDGGRLRSPTHVEPCCPSHHPFVCVARRKRTGAFQRFRRLGYARKSKGARMVRSKGIGRLRISVVLTLLALAAFAAVGTRGTAMAQGDTSVSIANFAFDPGSVTIDAGSTVTWTNSDSATHTVTSDDGTFDSGNLASGDSYSFTFDTPG